MAQTTFQDSTYVMDRLFDRRTALGALVGMGLVLTQRPRPILARETTGAPPLLVGETFVGQTDDPTTFIAIVLGESTEDDTQLAWAYLCDGLGHSVDAWFAGDVVNDQLALTADGGSRLFATRNAAGMGGGATLGDGRSLTFTVQHATDCAGLYSVDLLPGGRIAGTSAAQGALQGELLPPRTTGEYLPTLESPSEGQILGSPAIQAAQDEFWYSVRVITPEGRVVPMKVRTATAEEGVFSVILLASGQGRGQGTATATGAWIDPQFNLTR